MAGKMGRFRRPDRRRPDTTRAVRFNLYQLLIAANESDLRVNIGANALSGERYRGHAFWDTEVFMLPFFIYTQAEAARALLLYRYHTLDGARQNARDGGFRGARYAWESAGTGVETTPKWTWTAPTGSGWERRRSTSPRRSRTA